jgi:hypothetical protein
MQQHCAGASDRARRFIEYAELTKQCSPIVIDSLSCQAVFVIESEDPAERKFNMAAGWGQASPRPQVPASNDDLKDDGVRGRVTSPNVEV